MESLREQMWCMSVQSSLQNWERHSGASYNFIKYVGLKLACRKVWYRSVLGSFSGCQGVMWSHQQRSRQDWSGRGGGGGHFALIVWRVWPTHSVWNAGWPQLSLFYTPSVALWASVRHRMIQRLVGRFSVQTTECRNRPNYHRSYVGVAVLSLPPSHFCLAGLSDVCLSHYGWACVCVCLDICMVYYTGVNGYFSLL